MVKHPAASQSGRIFATLAFGFNPETWGAVGFSSERTRANLANDIGPRDWVLVIGTGGEPTPRELQGRLLALAKLSQRHTPTEDLVAPANWQQHLDENGGKPKWRYGLPITAAERFLSPPERKTILPRLHSNNLHMKLATNYVELTAEEVAEVLSLSREPLDDIYTSRGGEFAARMLKARPGPPPTLEPRILSPNSGPAATYCFELAGPASGAACGDLLNGRPGWRVIKVGFSNNPERRQSELNGFIPNEEQLVWKLRDTTWHTDEINAYALEQEIFRQLEARGAMRVKGEIFVASDEQLLNAWAVAKVTTKRPEAPVYLPARS